MYRPYRRHYRHTYYYPRYIYEPSYYTGLTFGSYGYGLSFGYLGHYGTCYDYTGHYVSQPYDNVDYNTYPSNTYHTTNIYYADETEQYVPDDTYTTYGYSTGTGQVYGPTVDAPGTYGAGTTVITAPAPTQQVFTAPGEAPDRQTIPREGTAASDGVRALPEGIEEGDAAFTAGQYEAARQAYIKAVLADDQDGYAKLLYGAASFAAGDYAVATVSVRRALLVTPELIEAPLDLRRLYASETTLKQQLGTLAQYVAQSPEQHGVRFLLGYLHYATGDPDRALTEFDLLTTIAPDDALAELSKNAAKRAIQAREASGS